MRNSDSRSNSAVTTHRKERALFWSPSQMGLRCGFWPFLPTTTGATHLRRRIAPHHILIMSGKKKEDDKKAKREAVEEAADELSESSSEEEELSLLGFFELKKGAKGDFKPVYGIVSAGSLFWYKDSRVRKRGRYRSLLVTSEALLSISRFLFVNSILIR